VNFALLETPIDPLPEFYVEAPDKDGASELARVMAFRRDLRVALPDARLVAVPNAAKRGAAAVRQAKAEGMATGFPDMMILHGGRIAFLEWKSARNKLSRQQIEWMNWLCANGFDAACVRTSAGAIAFLQSKGWPL
jgi:hypothetical protein